MTFFEDVINCRGFVLKWEPKKNEIVLAGSMGTCVLVANAFNKPRIAYNAKDMPPIKYEMSLLEELDERGYDLKTIKFTIRKKKGKKYANG